jgi:O-Antigen ligase
VFVVSIGVLIVIALALLIQLNAPDESETIYYAVAGVIVLTSFAFLLKPFAGLSLALIYLISPAPAVLSANYSAAIVLLLLGNCFAGSVLTSGFKIRFERDASGIPLLLGTVAIFGAAYGVALSNRASLVLGDFYQIIEFAALFFLARMLVKTEQQFRVLASVIIGSIIVKSVLQSADALMGASYLPRLNQPGIDVARTINMDAPIAFVALLAALAAVKNKRWILAGMGILAVNLIWSFTRGLWLATAASAVFLLIIQGGRFRRAVLKFALFSCVIAIPILYASGLGPVIGSRIGYSTEQFDSASEEDQTLSARRLLEYILILPQIVEHPLAGKGLGATYEISGAAVLEGPKGEQVDHHYVHNLYLLVAFRLGIPALLIFLVVLWRYFQRSIRNLRSLKLLPENSALMAGLIAAMFGEVVLSLTSPTFLNHPTAGVRGCIMALTLTALRSNSLSSPQT